MGGTPDTPDIPSAGENFAETIQAQLANQGSLRELEFLNQAGNLEIMRRLAPGLANFQLGFEDQFGSQFRAQGSEATRQNRLGDILNVQDLSPAFNQAVATSDPQTESIRAMLGGQIESELAAGAGLDDGLRREIQQGVRQAQTARGITRGNAPISEEAFAQGSAGLNLRRGRQTAAENFLRTQAATRPSALSFLTGGQSGTSGQGGSALAQLPQIGGQGAFNNQLFQQSQAQNNLRAQTEFNAAQAGQGGGFAGAAGGAMTGFTLSGGNPIGAVVGGLGGLLL